MELERKDFCAKIAIKHFLWGDMLFTIDDAQYIGLRLKAVLKYVAKCPAGATNAQLEREFPVSRVGNNLASLLELAIASELLIDEWDGDTQVFKIK